MNKEEKFNLAKDTILSLLRNYKSDDYEHDDLLYLWDFICELNCKVDSYER